MKNISFVKAGLAGAFLTLAQGCGHDNPIALAGSAPVLNSSTVQNQKPQAALPPQFHGLTDQDGRTVQPLSDKPDFIFLFVGFADCPMICPAGMNDITRLLQQLERDHKTKGLPDLSARITPVFLSVDTARDTPARLSEFLKAYDPRIIGLTGTQAQIDAIVDMYGAYYDRNPDGTIRSHSAFSILLTPQGTVRERYAWGFIADETAQAVRIQIQDYDLRGPQGAPVPAP